jgi:hypothetical protein
MNPEAPVEKKCRKMPSSEVLLSSEDHDLLRYSFSVDRGGYLRIGARKFGSRKVHKIIGGRMGFVTNVENKMQIDHINRNRLDNRRENLRLVSKNANVNNVDFVLEAKGYDIKNGFYCPRVRINNELIPLGKFSTVEEARKVYVEAKNKYLTSLGLTDLLLKE